jgi:heme-degrading monooxygenase HmoA
MTDFAPLAGTPYVAVIFTSQQADDVAGYGEAAEAMEALAREQPGYVGIESARSAGGFGITVSYWATDADARAWKHVVDHVDVQQRGRSTWYERYAVRVAKIEREYGWERDMRPSHDRSGSTE